MENVNSYLANWSIRFLENKDTIKREIVKIDKNSDGFDFVIQYKDKTKYFIVKINLNKDIFSQLNDNSVSVIALNNNANIRFVVSEWKKLVEFKFLNIYFVNPFSVSDKVWIIYPYIHDKICDKESLELGLKSIAEMVNQIGLEELKNKIKLLGKEVAL